MRAWQIGGGFGIDRLEIVEHDPGAPGAGEVRIAVKAVGLNYRDLLMVTGAYNPRQPLPLVPGSDAVGVVTEVGPGVRALAVGDRVIPAFAQAWRAGTPERWMMASTLGGPLPGVLREAMVVAEDAVVLAPSHLTDAECATLPCAAVTAWRALVTEGRIRAGDVVLTQGTGGVSLFALQIARMHGAKVVITSSSDDRIVAALALGASHGVNYRSDARWGRTVSSWTGGRGVDQVIELGGADTLAQSLAAVRPGGTVSLIGMLGGTKAEVELTRIFMAGVRVQGIFVGCREDLADLCRALTAAPDVRPVIDRVLPFEALPAALGQLQDGGHFGKIVIAVG